MTLHRLLYDHMPLPGGGYYRKPKKILGYTIVVVDEVSMVPKSMIDQLLKHKVYVIFLGDPFQLDVIDKEEHHDLLEHPHIFLDEVMRQAAESEIIRMTMDIRNGIIAPYHKGEEVMVMPYKELVDGCYTWADQIICATNAKRHEINTKMREMLGYNGLPQDGEKMICLRNYWDDTSDLGDALVNGTTGIISNVSQHIERIPGFIKCDNHNMECIDCTFTTGEGSIFKTSMDKHMILTGEKCIDWRVSYKLGKIKDRIGDIVPREFAFGYCITTHKAQGSEWDKVLVLEETYPYEKIEHLRWLYTAATRASQKLVLVKG